MMNLPQIDTGPGWGRMQLGNWRLHAGLADDGALNVYISNMEDIQVWDPDTGLFSDPGEEIHLRFIAAKIEGGGQEEHRVPFTLDGLIHWLITGNDGKPFLEPFDIYQATNGKLRVTKDQGRVTVTDDHITVSAPLVKDGEIDFACWREVKE
jgi:hypothetical protein